VHEHTYLPASTEGRNITSSHSKKGLIVIGLSRRNQTRTFPVTTTCAAGMYTSIATSSSLDQSKNPGGKKTCGVGIKGCAVDGDIGMSNKSSTRWSGVEGVGTWVPRRAPWGAGCWGPKHPWADVDLLLCPGGVCFLEVDDTRLSICFFFPFWNERNLGKEERRWCREGWLVGHLGLLI
jgi:hypothetical protein